MTRHASRSVTVAVALVVAALGWVAATRARVADLPARLGDGDFWALSESASEPNGEFQSDNFLSNERGYQVVIPDLLDKAKPGRVYLGVGPEQNYPYIIALKPALAVIFDVRRGNLHEQLLYKALFEMSSDRADFLSRLFSRPRPEGLSASSTVAELMAAYETVEPTPDRYQKNLEADRTSVTAWEQGAADEAASEAGTTRPTQPFRNSTTGAA
jgi:hypothetical protein